MLNLYTSFLSLQIQRHPSNGKNYVIATALIELVDISPTIADIANLPLPLCDVDEDYDYRTNPVTLCSEGISFLPVVYAAMSGKVKVHRICYYFIIFRF